MARKSSVDAQLDDLRAYVDEAYLQDPANRQALAAQGVPLPPLPSLAPRSDASNPFTGDENGPATTDANGITAVNARDVSVENDPLDALTADVQRMQDATVSRRTADRLKAKYPDSDQAQQQQTADQIQAALGDARRLSNTTQSGIRNRVFAAADRLGAVSTPGGIAALLLIIWLLLFILYEVNGQPRGVWLWLVLLRKAHLMPEAQGAALSSGVVGGTEQAASSPSEIPTVNQQTVAAYGQTAAAGAGITPINPAGFGSILLGGAGSALDRYINP